jgi:hypothetical protein
METKRSENSHQHQLRGVLRARQSSALPHSPARERAIRTHTQPTSGWIPMVLLGKMMEVESRLSLVIVESSTRSRARSLLIILTRVAPSSTHPFLVA